MVLEYYVQYLNIYLSVVLSIFIFILFDGGGGGCDGVITGERISPEARRSEHFDCSKQSMSGVVR